MNLDDEIAPPKRSLSFARALRESVRRNFWLIFLFFTFVGMIGLRGFLGGNMRSMLINAGVWGLIAFVISITLAPAIRKQNAEERLKRDSRDAQGSVNENTAPATDQLSPEQGPT